MTAIQDIRTWVQTVVTDSVPVLFTPLNGPAPARPYMTLTQITDNGSPYPSIQREYIEATEETAALIRYTAQVWRELTVSLQAYADDGDELLNRIKAYASLPQQHGRPFMRDCGTIRDLTFLDDEEFKKRYQCDYTFACSYETTADDYSVETLSITGQAADIDASVSYEKEV